jgi:hypothetical protein
LGRRQRAEAERAGASSAAAQPPHATPPHERFLPGDLDRRLAVLDAIYAQLIELETAIGQAAGVANSLASMVIQHDNDTRRKYIQEAFSSIFTAFSFQQPSARNVIAYTETRLKS